LHIVARRKQFSFDKKDFYGVKTFSGTPPEGGKASQNSRLNGGKFPYVRNPGRVRTKIRPVKALIVNGSLKLFSRLPERYFHRIIVYCCCTF
jgi:hypothetical protein